MKITATNIWIVSSIILCIFIIFTISSILIAFFKKVKLEKPDIWFEQTTNFNGQLNRLKEHSDRIGGTLGYWKNKAALHNRIHMSRIYWSLITSVILPVLLQFYDKNDLWANVFLTVMTTWTAIISTLAYTLKSEEKYRGFRQCESDYYDLSRELLDNPADDGDDLKKQVDEYLEKVSQIRKLGRTIETDSTVSVRTCKKY